MSRQRVQRLSDWEDARYSTVPPRASRDGRLSWTHGRLLIELGRVNTKQGWCELSQKALAEVLGIARQTINIAVGELVEWGYIQKKSQQETGTAFCQYRVAIDPPNQVADVSPPDDTPPVSPPDDTRVTPQMTPVSATSTDTHLEQRSEINPPTPKGARSLVQQFEEFWKVYPRKVEMSESWRIWHLIVTGRRVNGDGKVKRKASSAPRATAEELIAAARAYAQKMKGTEDRFIVGCPRWLNKARWLDEPVKDRASETVTNLKFNYSAKKNPAEYAIWLEYCRQPDALPDYRRRLCLWENHGFVLVDRPFPPGYEAPQP